MTQTCEEIIQFWLDAGPARWFAKDPEFDRQIVIRFGDLVADAVTGRLEAWLVDPRCALALVLLLDQFPRNMWRDDPRAFSGDLRALEAAREAIQLSHDMALGEDERRWFYMPFMHSEDLAAQEEGLAYFGKRIDDANTYKYAVDHRDIVKRFGRFPHRNQILQRSSTEEEQNFLDEGGFAG